MTEKEIVLADNYMSVPKSTFSRKILSIKYSEIKELDIHEKLLIRVLTIFHKDGKLTISESLFPNTQAFEDLVAFVSTKING